MIDLEKVTRTYGPKVAVDGLDLTIPKGELFAFLGPNGAGKTTTMKMLVGLLRPTSGRIRLAGFDTATAAREACRRIGYVPDEPYLYDKLSGREFLEFVAGMHGLSGAARDRAIDEQVQTFELEDFLDDLTERYSHGMKQRLVFAAALVHGPDVLLVDEPMVGLDPRSARLTRMMLRSKADAGTTVFMSTHTLPLVEEIADRIGIIDHGRLRFLGTVGELRSASQSPDHTLEDLFLRLTDADEPEREPLAPRIE
jgi:ABC-2 type transport system ATP-binding protein